MPRIPDMVALFGGMPNWLSLLFICIAMAYSVCVFGVVFAKMGRSPYWGLAFILPFVGTMVLWTFGLGRWPQAPIDDQPESGL